MLNKILSLSVMYTYRNSLVPFISTLENFALSSKKIIAMSTLTKARFLESAFINRKNVICSLNNIMFTFTTISCCHNNDDVTGR